MDASITNRGTGRFRAASPEPTRAASPDRRPPQPSSQNTPRTPGEVRAQLRMGLAVAGVTADLIAPLTGRSAATVRDQLRGRWPLREDVAEAAKRLCHQVSSRRRRERPHELRQVLPVPGTEPPLVVTRFLGTALPGDWPAFDRVLDTTEWQGLAKSVAWLVGGLATEPGYGLFDVCLPTGETWSIHTAIHRNRDRNYSFRGVRLGADAHLLIGYADDRRHPHEAEVYLVPHSDVVGMLDVSLSISVPRSGVSRPWGGWGGRDFRRYAVAWKSLRGPDPAVRFDERSWSRNIDRAIARGKARQAATPPQIQTPHHAGSVPVANGGGKEGHIVPTLPGRPRCGNRRWSQTDIDLLRQLYPDSSKPSSAIAVILGRSRPSIRRKAIELGLARRVVQRPGELAPDATGQPSEVPELYGGAIGGRATCWQETIVDAVEHVRSCLVEIRDGRAASNGPAMASALETLGLMDKIAIESV